MSVIIIGVLLTDGTEFAAIVMTSMRQTMRPLPPDWSSYRLVDGVTRLKSTFILSGTVARSVSCV